MSVITLTRADGTVEEGVTSNEAVVIYGVDAGGNYLGLVAPGDGVTQVPGAPPDAAWVWSFDAGRWTFQETLEVLIADALDVIDRQAGARRLVFITDVPGQQGTYVMKADQAAAFIAAPDGAVPPYVQAEADAMGATPLDAAQYIAATAAVWNDVVGPAIERERRRGKILVAAAADSAGVQAALDAALAALAAISPPA